MSKNLSVNLFSQALLAISQVAFPLITYPVITQALGAEGLGQVNFTDSLAQLLIIVASIGLPVFGVREIAAQKGNPALQSLTFSELVFIQFLFTLPAIALMWLAGSRLNIPDAMLFLAMLNIVANSLTCEWFLQGNEAFFFVAIRSVLIRLLGTLLIISFVKETDDITLYYSILVGMVVITACLNWMVILKNLKLSFRSINIKSRLINISWLYGCYLLISVYTVLDSILLGILSSATAVGLYSFGYKLTRLSAMFVISLGVVFIPRITFQHVQGNHEKLKEEISASQQVIFFFSLPLSVGFFILAPEIVQVLANQHFEPAVNVIRILSFLPLLVGFSHFTGMQLMIPFKIEKTLFWFLAAGCLSSILLNLTLIPLLQEKAAAIANVITEGIITLGTSLYLSRKKLISFAAKPFLLYLTGSLIIIPVAISVRLLQLPPLVTLLLIMGIFSLLYLFICLKLPGNIVRRIITFQQENA